MRYQLISAFQCSVHRLLRRGTLAALTAIAVPAVAHAAIDYSRVCAGLLPNTAVDQSTLPAADGKPNNATNGFGGSAEIIGSQPTFAPAPSGCQGYTTTDWTFAYGILPSGVGLEDNGRTNLFYMHHFSAEISNSGFPQVVNTITDVNGKEQASSGFSLPAIEVDTYVAEQDGTVIGGKSELTIHKADLLPDGSFGEAAFSDAVRLPRTTDQPPIFLDQDVIFTFAQSSTAMVGDFFEIDFPNSIISVIAPVPEPSSLVLMASALGGLAVVKRRKRRACCSGRATAPKLGHSRR
jgi:hypothetical protein